MGSRTDPRAAGLAAGLLWGGLVAVLELTAGTEYGERFRLLLADIYPGYSSEPGDLVWGSVLGFVDGFLAGYLYATLYNRFARNVS